MAVATLAISQIGCAQPPAASPFAATSATSDGLVAQFQAALIKERRLADDREAQQLAEAEVAMRSARQRFDLALTRSKKEVETARSALIAARQDFRRQLDSVMRREASARVEVERFRAEVTGVVAQASPERLAALERFGDGDRVAAWQVIAELTQASVRARVAAAQAAAAADVRELARLREIMRDNGEATAVEVLALWDQAYELDPSDYRTSVQQGRLAGILGRYPEGAAAFVRAVRSARDDRERLIALEERGSLLLRARDDVSAARDLLTESLEVARGLAAADPQSVTLARDVLRSAALLGDALAQIGDSTGAQQRYSEALGISLRLSAVDSTSLTLQDDLAASLSRVADVLQATGNLTAARARREQALRIRRALVSRSPSSRAALRALSSSLDALGNSDSDSNPARARAVFEESLALTRRLALADSSS
ncbi:MAG: hypothetical protein IT358_13235 [Gemmatimonadaceae bacterium]|nr:hypothetical protein [Gemmatimonadaceae bacterium]